MQFVMAILRYLRGLMLMGVNILDEGFGSEETVLEKYGYVYQGD